MAKKSTDLTGLLAFIALLLAGICMLLSILIKYFGDIDFFQTLARANSALQMISYICLVIVVAFAGWRYASSLGAKWQAIYIVLVLLALCGIMAI